MSTNPNQSKYSKNLTAKIESIHTALDGISKEDCVDGILANRKATKALYHEAESDLEELIAVLPKDRNDSIYKNSIWGGCAISIAEGNFMGKSWLEYVIGELKITVPQSTDKGLKNIDIQMTASPWHASPSGWLRSEEYFLSKELLNFSLCECLDKYRQSAEDLETAKKLVNVVKKERYNLMESLEAMETKIKETAKDLATIKKTGIALL